MEVTYVAPESENSDGIAMYTKNLRESIPYETRYIDVTRKFDLFECLKIIKQIDSFSSDVVHIQYADRMFPPGMLGNITGGKGSFSFLYILLPLFFICRIKSQRLIITVHELAVTNEPDHLLGNVYFLAQSIFFRTFSDEIIILSDEFNDVFENSRKISHGAPQHLVPSVSQNDARQEFGIDKNKIVCILPGYIYPRKGTDVFVDTARHCSEITFLVAGGVPNEESEDFADSVKQRAAENVVFTGVLPRKKYHLSYEAADIAMLPYRSIAQSGVLNDCAAHSLPVVASQLSYFEGKPGILTVDINIPEADDYPDDSWEKSKQFCEYASVVIDRKDELGEKIRKIANKNSFARIARKHVQIYELGDGRQDQ